MNRADTLQTLARWREAGWLRPLDLALARFVHETDPEAPAALLLATALTAHLEGRGHGALPLAEVANDLPGLLGWPPEAAAEWPAARAVWPGGAEACAAAWRGLAALEVEPAGSAGASPLVLSNGLLYLRRYWGYETRVAAQVKARVAPPAAGVDEAAAQAELDRLFGPSDPDAETNWQKEACAQALRGRLTLITGGPGTGKTFTAARLLVLMHRLHAGPQPLRVALAAPTGKAAARLRQSIGKALQDLGDPLAAQVGPARTLHSLLGTLPGTRRFRHDASNPLDVDLLFVDEASMVHLEMMARLLEALPPQARVVLLGDKDQLASVEAGAVLGDLCQASGGALARQTVVLRKSHRFEGPIGQLALAANEGDANAALALLRAPAGGPLALLEARDAAAVVAPAVQGYRDCLQRLAQRPAGAEGHADWVRAVLRGFDEFRVLCALREGAWGVGGLNAAIETALARAGLLSRRGEWYEGRPVMVTRNDPASGVFNGDIGIVLRGPGPQAALRCWFGEGEALHPVSVGRLADVETAFAMTVHKSQGSEFGHVLLVLPEDDSPVLTRELAYTGITRARRAFTLAARRPAVLAAALGRRTRRVSGLRQRL